MGGESMEKSDGGDQPKNPGEKEQERQGTDHQVLREKRRRTVSPDGGDAVGGAMSAEGASEGASAAGGAPAKKRVNIHHTHRHSCCPHKIDSHSADSIGILGSSCIEH